MGIEIKRRPTPGIPGTTEFYLDDNGEHYPIARVKDGAVEKQQRLAAERNAAAEPDENE